MFEEFDTLHTKTSYLINKYKFISNENYKNKLLLDEKRKELDIMNKSSIVASKAVEDTFKFLQENITDIAGKALSCVFDTPYSIDFVIGTRGQKTRTNTVKIQLKKDGVVLSKNLLQSVEGGQLAVLSVVLRTAFLMLKEDARKILLLDEVLAAVSRVQEEDGGSNLKRATQMIEQLADLFGLQVILVSHVIDK